MLRFHQFQDTPRQTNVHIQIAVGALLLVLCRFWPTSELSYSVDQTGLRPGTKYLCDRAEHRLGC